MNNAFSSVTRSYEYYLFTTFQLLLQSGLQKADVEGYVEELMHFAEIVGEKTSQKSEGNLSVDSM